MLGGQRELTAQTRLTLQSQLRVLIVPAIVCGLMLGVATITSDLARLDVHQLFLPYFATGLSISFLATLGYVFIKFAALARIQADKPVAKVAAMLAERVLLLILPAVMLPLFLIGYTATKCAIPFLVGYSWDSYFAALDRSLFGADVWHLLRQLIGNSASRALEWCYTAGWGAVFFGAANAVVLFGNKRLIGTYFTATFAAWLVGGCFLAYRFSAAGPVFAGMFDPELAARFAPMHQVLDATLGSGPIAFTQNYLAHAADNHVVLNGRGISAMPSMHVAAASTYVLAARRTPWLIPAILFWIVIFVSSGYFGYHYWVDGLVAVAVVGACWLGSASIYRRETPAPRLEYRRI